MSEKISFRIILILSVVIIVMGGWIIWIYRDRGNTQDHLDTATTQLTASYRGNEYLAQELRRSATGIFELEDQQRETRDIVAQFEFESKQREEYIKRLEAAEREGSEAVGRIEDILESNTGLFADGNRYIEDREK